MKNYTVNRQAYQKIKHLRGFVCETKEIKVHSFPLDKSLECRRLLYDSLRSTRTRCANRGCHGNYLYLHGRNVSKVAGDTQTQISVPDFMSAYDEIVAMATKVGRTPRRRELEGLAETGAIQVGQYRLQQFYSVFFAPLRFKPLLEVPGLFSCRHRCFLSYCRDVLPPPGKKCKIRRGCHLAVLALRRPGIKVEILLLSSCVIPFLEEVRCYCTHRLYPS